MLQVRVFVWRAQDSEFRADHIWALEAALKKIHGAHRAKWGAAVSQSFLGLFIMQRDQTSVNWRPLCQLLTTQSISRLTSTPTAAARRRKMCLYEQEYSPRVDVTAERLRFLRGLVSVFAGGPRVCKRGCRRWKRGRWLLCSPPTAASTVDYNRAHRPDDNEPRGATQGPIIWTAGVGLRHWMYNPGINAEFISLLGFLKVNYWLLVTLRLQHSFRVRWAASFHQDDELRTDLKE